MSISIQDFNRQCESFCQIDQIRDDGWVLCVDDSNTSISRAQAHHYVRKGSHVIPSQYPVAMDPLSSPSSLNPLRASADRNDPAGPADWHRGVDWDVEDIDDIDTHHLEESTESATDGYGTTDACLLEFEVHIVYSELFRVPVLYFRMIKKRISDGQIVHLTNDQVVSEIFAIQQQHSHSNPDKVLIAGKDQEQATSNRLSVPQGMFVTCGEHPVLGTVFYYVHPCQTRDVMEEVQSGSSSAAESQANCNYILSWLSLYGATIGVHIPRHVRPENSE